MAKTTQPKDILSRVADLGEEAFHKLADAPGSAKIFEVMNQSRTRLDEMQKRLRGLDELEKRVEKLEKKLETMTKKPAASSAKSTTAKKPAPPAAKKPASS